jgi:hypothetical protein
MEGSTELELYHDEKDTQIEVANTHASSSGEIIETPTIDLFINGASNLKTLLYIWKAMSNSFVFNFTRDRIFSTANNRNNTIIIGLDIPENKLIKYSFDVNQLIDGNEATQEEIDQICVIGAVPTDELESRLRSCGKGANFTLTIWPNDSNLYFKQTGVEKGTSFIPMKLCDIKQYNPPEMPEHTIVRIMTSDFVSAIKSAIPDKVDKFNFIPFVDGLHIITVGSAGQTIGHTPFGNCTTRFGDESLGSSGSNSGKVSGTTGDKDLALKQLIQSKSLVKRSNASGSTTSGGTKPTKGRVVVRNSANNHTITIDALEIKSLSRLGSVSPESSIISIYYNPVLRALMLEGLVGTFGTYRLYLRNKKISGARLNGNLD